MNYGAPICSQLMQLTEAMRALPAGTLLTTNARGAQQPVEAILPYLERLLPQCSSIGNDVDGVEVVASIAHLEQQVAALQAPARPWFPWLVVGTVALGGALIWKATR